MNEKRIRELEAENRRLREALKESEISGILENDLFKGITDSLKDGVSVCDSGKNLLYVNNAIREEFGEIKGQKCYRYFYGRDTPCQPCMIEDEGEIRLREWKSPLSKKIFDVTEYPLVAASGSRYIIRIMQEMTDRKIANRRIKDLAMFPTENPNPVIRMRFNGKIIYSNKAGVKLLAHWDYRVGSIVPPDDLEAIHNLCSGKKFGSMDVEYDGRTFSLIFVKIRKKNYFNIYGQDVTKLVSLSRERLRHISELESLTLETRKRTLELEVIFNSIAEPVMILDTEGRIINCNERVIEFFGFNPVGLSNMDIYGKLMILTSPEQAASQQELPSVRAINGEEVKNERFYLKKESGERIATIVSGAPIIIDDKVIGAVLLWHDITDQIIREENLKRVKDSLEIEVREKEDQLVKQATLLDRIFSNTHIAIAYLDADFNFIRVNNAYAREGNRQTDYFPGKNHFEVYPDPENEKIFKRCVEGGEPFFTYARPFSYPDNPERGVTYWDWSLLPIKDTGGKVEGLIFTLLNVSERIRSIHKLQKTMQELQSAQRLSYIGKLAATVAHELRTPLAVIETATYNIEKKCDRDTIAPHIGSIEKKLSEAEQIISNLLMYAKLKMPIFEQVEIREFLNECIDAVQSRFSGMDYAMIREFPSGEISVPVDPFQMREVFNNILVNACQALPESGGKITVSLRSLDECLRIDFTDNGDGISEEDMERVFAPFYSTRTRGTGLGLAICREVMDLHNGEIDIKSKPGEGTRISLLLPFIR